MQQQLQQLQHAALAGAGANDVQQKQVEEVRDQIDHQAKATVGERKEIEDKEKKLAEFDVQLRKRKEQMDQLGGGATAAGGLNKELVDSGKRKPAVEYKVGDIVAIRRTQFVAGKKLAGEYKGPYEVSRLKRNGRYDVRKATDFEGPSNTFTSCD